MTYSIVIRTLGTGGEKYQALLDSIACQKVQPQHVYVVIAEGYKIPQEQIGTEEFLFTKKGMLHQRAYGLEYANVHCHSDFILCLDDDIAFDSDYAAKALVIIGNTDCNMLMPTALSIGGGYYRNYKSVEPRQLLCPFGSKGGIPPVTIPHIHNSNCRI